MPSPGRAMSTSLSIGVAMSIGLSMVRVLTGISIFWLLIPGYLAAITMSFFTPKIFTAIAFDSGGVASGPMTATFLLPFAMGACDAIGGSIITDAFGVVAGGHDAADHHPDAGTALSVPPEEEWHQRRADRPGG